MESILLKLRIVFVALIITLIITLPYPKVEAQLGTPFVGDTLPSVCVVGNLGYQTASTIGLYVCSTINTWTLVSPPNNTGVPSGSLLLITSGTCPTGFTQSTALNGFMLRGTIAANGDVGTTAGSDSITPTVATLTAAAQGFTGNSVASSAVSGGTPAGTNGTSATTGNCATTNIAAGTGSTTACKATAPNLTVSAQTFTGSILATHTHTTTATGTNGTSAVTGTLNSFNNRPAYMNVIFCSKN